MHSFKSINDKLDRGSHIFELIFRIGVIKNFNSQKSTCAEVSFNNAVGLDSTTLFEKDTPT